ncbi:MAG: J domain-containing protein [Candidatus Vogelbacteria bacterium]
MKTLTVKNPYLILGITSDIAKAVSAEDLDTLAKQHYRVLAKSFHPDRRGEKFTARFRQIQEAHEVLLDPGEKEHWLADLKTKKANERGSVQLAKLNGQLETESQRGVLLAEQLFRFWSAMLSDQTISIFSSRPLSLLMINLTDSSMLEKRMKSQWAADKISRQAFSRSCYELVVGDQGRSLTRQSLVRLAFDKESEIPIGLPAQWVQRRKGKNKSFYWQRVGDKELLANYRLIGSLEDTPIFGTSGDKETRLDRLIPAQAEPEDYRRVRATGFPWAMFREYAHAVSPTITLSGQVVAVCSEPDGQTVFRLMGRVNQINLLEN